ncbi:hypothetical protein ETD86_54705 [Nonomuraea turkmeniaca]|uniref:Uncharacterized protein n=1 Tax=Nonomuraea turkmeniaca TaxID=103838 RepID=A0A5S4EUA3_9ACTN|nr:hypothetical protein [Nonomuraea turkmeniaca]TMR00401.1 hypothetical protein ETD86_54705 [Nonomuraea turkmeniaca]
MLFDLFRFVYQPAIALPAFVIGFVALALACFLASRAERRAAAEAETRALLGYVGYIDADTATSAELRDMVSAAIAEGDLFRCDACPLGLSASRRLSESGEYFATCRRCMPDLISAAL